MNVQDDINRILWDRRLIILPVDLDGPYDYVFLKNPTLEDRNHYQAVRQIEEFRGRQAAVPTEGEIFANARQANYWGKFEDDIEAKADDHIAFLQAELEAKSKFKSRQNIIKLQIEDAVAKKKAVQAKKNELKSNTCEYLAHEIACCKLLCRVALGPDETPLFPTEDAFLYYKNNEPQFISFLLREMMIESTFSTSEIRAIAKSIEWRLIWTLSRENLPSIFNCPVGDLSLDQRMLIYWSRIYDSALESMEPPNKEILDDDDLFDSWLANRDLNNREKDKQSHHQEQGQVLDGEYSEHCNCGAKEKNKGKYLGEKTMHANDCPYGTWHYYTPEEKEAKSKLIYTKNNRRIRDLMDQEQDQVLKKGMIEEQHLRDKKSRKLLNMKNNVIPIKKR